MEKLLFVFNPHSGKGQIRYNLVDIVDEMVKAGYEVRVHPTQERDEARRIIAAEAKNYDLVVCSGGDGTLDEAVAGIMESGTNKKLGYIPAGSTNDFANSIGIPKGMKEAAFVATHGEGFSCDVGVFGEKNFIYVAAFGKFTDVAYDTRQELKNILGHAAYIIEGAKRLSDIKSYKMKVEYENQTIEGDFIIGMITNSTSVGGFKGMTGPDVKLDDGLFEVTLIRRPTNLIEMNEILASIAKLVDDTDYVYTFKTDKIKFTCLDEEVIPWTLDGEYGGSPESVEISVSRKAIEIVVPDANELIS